MTPTTGWPEVFGVIVALGLLLLLGRSFLALCVRDVELRWTERWALYFLVGTCGISLLTFWLSPLFSLIPAQWLLSLVAIGLGSSHYPGGVARLQAPPCRTSMTQDAVASAILVLGIAIQCAALGWLLFDTARMGRVDEF